MLMRLQVFSVISLVVLLVRGMRRGHLEIWWREEPHIGLRSCRGSINVDHTPRSIGVNVNQSLKIVSHFQVWICWLVILISNIVMTLASLEEETTSLDRLRSLRTEQPFLLLSLGVL